MPPMPLPSPPFILCPLSPQHHTTPHTLAGDTAAITQATAIAAASGQGDTLAQAAASAASKGGSASAQV